MLINDPDNLSQGTETAVSDAVWGAPTGVQVTISSGGAELPAISAGDFFAVRGHSNTQNNGLYKETGGSPTTSSTQGERQGREPTRAKTASSRSFTTVAASTHRASRSDSTVSR